MKYAVLGSLVILSFVNPALGEEETLEFKSETAQVIEGESMVFPFESAEVKKNLKDLSKKIDFFSAWKNKINKSAKTNK
tara:strand:- start:467 stop:703 length:237 start_codon:yes stop_codon:yes gene_type:complete